MNFLFWKLYRKFGIKSTKISSDACEDQRVNEILKHITRCIENEYETGLLWRPDKTNPPDSLPMALNRNKCLMKKIEKNKDL